MHFVNTTNSGRSVANVHASNTAFRDHHVRHVVKRIIRLENLQEVSSLTTHWISQALNKSKCAVIKYHSLSAPNQYVSYVPTAY